VGRRREPQRSSDLQEQVAVHPLAQPGVRAPLVQVARMGGGLVQRCRRRALKSSLRVAAVGFVWRPAVRIERGAVDLELSGSIGPGLELRRLVGQGLELGRLKSAQRQGGKLRSLAEPEHEPMCQAASPSERTGRRPST